ncbi:transposase [Streptomyces sp. V4I23]|nr:transposase [Streptomyces sp. V4I23]
MFREKIRLRAGERFAAGEKTAVIAKDLRVSVRSVERWRRAWREGGMEALRSAGPANSPTVTAAQFAVLEEELGKGPSAHGFDDDRWTLARVQTVIRRRLRLSLSVATVWRLLKRHGWSWQAPARRALERDEHAVELWKKEVWPRVKASRRPVEPGSSSSCAVRRCDSCGGVRPCATRRCDPRAGVRPAPSSRRSGTAEAGGSWARRVGRVWWRAAPTTTGRTGTTGRCGSGKRDGKVDERNQRCKAPQDLRQLKPGGSGLDSGAHCSYGQELLDRIDLAGREATVKDCGVTVAMPQGQSWPPHPTSGSE